MFYWWGGIHISPGIQLPSEFWAYLCWSDTLLDLSKDVSTLRERERGQVVMKRAKRYMSREMDCVEMSINIGNRH